MHPLCQIGGSFETGTMHSISRRLWNFETVAEFRGSCKISRELHNFIGVAEFRGGCGTPQAFVRRMWEELTESDCNRNKAWIPLL